MIEMINALEDFINLDLPFLLNEEKRELITFEAPWTGVIYQRQKSLDSYLRRTKQNLNMEEPLKLIETLLMLMACQRVLIS